MRADDWKGKEVVRVAGPLTNLSTFAPAFVYMDQRWESNPGTTHTISLSPVSLLRLLFSYTYTPLTYLCLKGTMHIEFLCLLSV